MLKYIAPFLLLASLQCDAGQVFERSGTIVSLSDADAISVSKDKRERLVFFEDGFEITAHRFPEEFQRQKTVAEHNCLVDVDAFPKLGVGQTFGVLLDYRYPPSHPDRLRSLNLRVGDYEILIHTDVTVAEAGTRKKVPGSATYLVPFDMLARHDGSVWFFVTAEANGLRLSMMKADEPDYMVSCFWALEMKKTAVPVAFGMYRWELIERPHHNGTSHFFRKAWQGELDQAKLPTLRKMPRNTAVDYIRSVPSRYTRKHESLKVDFHGLPKPEEYRLMRDFMFERYGSEGRPRVAQAMTIPWLYDRTGDRKFLDGMLRSAEEFYRLRNDVNPNLRIGMSDGLCQAESFVIDKVPPMWSLYRVSWYDRQDKLAVPSSIADYVGFVTAASTARAIAEHPELWGEAYTGEVEAFQGKNYYEVAQVLLGRSREVLDFLAEYHLYHPDRDKLIKPWVSREQRLYLSPGMAEEVPGIVPYFNRLFPVLLGQMQVVKTLRLFDQDESYADLLDQNLKDHMTNFLEYTHVDHQNGRKILLHPYAASGWPGEDLDVEDLGHGNADSLFLMFFYEDGYFPAEYAALYANTALNMYRGNGTFHGYLDARSGGKPGRRHEVQGFFYLAQFEPEVIDTIWEGCFDNDYMQMYAILRAKEARVRK